MWGQDAKINKIVCLRRPTRVGFGGNPAKPNLDASPLILPPTLSIGAWLAVPLAPDCPRVEGLNTTQHGKKSKIWGHRERCILHISG